MKPTPQSLYRKRMIAKGYRRCQIWVHHTLEDKCRRIVHELDAVRVAKELLKKEGKS